jgi:hypothetical protein
MRESTIRRALEIAPDLSPDQQRPGMACKKEAGNVSLDRTARINDIRKVASTSRGKERLLRALDGAGEILALRCANHGKGDFLSEQCAKPGQEAGAGPCPVQWTHGQAVWQKRVFEEGLVSRIPPRNECHRASSGTSDRPSNRGKPKLEPTNSSAILGVGQLRMAFQEAFQ